MGFNCLKAAATLRRQFTFYHSVPRNSWYSFYWPRKDERLSRPCSHPVVLNMGPLDWESSTFTTWPEEILNVPVNSISYALYNDLSTISSTWTSRLKLDNAEYKDILENFKERSSKNWFSICSLKMYICYRRRCCLKGYLGTLIHL